MLVFALRMRAVVAEARRMLQRLKEYVFRGYTAPANSYRFLRANRMLGTQGYKYFGFGQAGICSVLKGVLCRG